MQKGDIEAVRTELKECREALDTEKRNLDAFRAQYSVMMQHMIVGGDALVQERIKSRKLQRDNIRLVKIVKNYEHIERKFMRKHRKVKEAQKTLNESHEALIAGIDALTDNFDPVTGGRLFDAAGYLQFLASTDQMQDIKPELCKQVRDWIRGTDKEQDDHEPEEGEDAAE